MKLRDVNFGSSDGQHESREHNFSEMFYEDGGHYAELKDTRKYIIIGRKGTGKTTLAAYAYLQSQKNKDTISKQLFANDFIQKKLLNFAQDEINREENSLFWEYVFLLDIGNMLVEYYNSLPFLSMNKLLQRKKVSELSKLLNVEQLKIENTVINNGSEQTISSGINLSVKPSGNIDSKSIMSNSETITKRRAKYYETLTELKKIVLELLKKSKLSLTVFYDDMDQFEESIELNYFLSLMKNMIYSADKLNSILCENNNSKVCLVLRKDIVDALQANAHNINKQITDSGIIISWFDNGYKEPYDHPLMQMVLHKVKNSSQEFYDTSIEDIYNSMFEKSTFDFLMERSFGRPRDIIQYLNLCKKAFPDNEMINIADLKKVEQQYSEWFYNEILNELALSESKEVVAEVFQIITSRGYPTFKKGQLLNYINTHEEYGEINNLLEILSIMRDYSILGTKKNRNFSFAYRLGFNPPVSEDTKFVVHKGLLKFLTI